jgi:hypothetical protein
MGRVRSATRWARLDLVVWLIGDGDGMGELEGQTKWVCRVCLTYLVVRSRGEDGIGDVLRSGVGWLVGDGSHGTMSRIV